MGRYCLGAFWPLEAGTVVRDAVTSNIELLDDTVKELKLRIFSDAVVYFMKQRNYQVISYIDDFLCIENSYSRCLEAMDVLSDLLVSLGFVINDKKREGPESTLSFLGVSIDCVRRTLSLPQKKLLEMRSLLTTWSGKSKCTKRELQQLLGSLNWCSRVVRGGRTFSRMLINLLCRASKPYHHIRLTNAAKGNVAWWIKALTLFNGDCPFFTDIPMPSFIFGTDACSVGGGSHFLPIGCTWIGFKMFRSRLMRI